MEIKMETKDQVTLVVVKGEINISTSPELKKSFEKLTTNKVIINMANVGYIDSSGLATLVELLKRVKTKGGNLGLSQVSEKVKSLFEITKLDKLFSIHPSDEVALSRIK